MSDLTCAQVEESATEYALGILPPVEARAVSDHVSACPACQRELQETSRIGDRLLELIPDAEPPLGFDHRVLASLQTGPGRGRTPRVVIIVAGAAAALVAVVALAATMLTGHTRGPHNGDLTAALRQGDRTVGSLYIGGHPTWVTMTVHHAGTTGTVTCQLLDLDGSTTTLGDFQLVDGSGTWSAPDPLGGSKVAGARLISTDGTVLAIAIFPSR